MTKIEALKSKLDEFDTILIGAGAGLSASAGYTYSGQRFDEYFADFRDRYGFTDMYSGGFYPYETQEEFWAYWSRYIMINRYSDIPKPVYSDLLRLVQDKDYFVITTNVDHCFQKAGFDKKRLFYTQGDYGLFQCSEPCHQQTYDNEQPILRMWQAGGMSIPSELIPHCPKCGKPMSMNLRSDDTFVQDEGWYAASERYAHFIDSRHVSSGGKVLLLELGVGGNTPVIIKYPFWQMTARNPNAFYVCINYGEAAAQQEIADRSLCIDADIGAILAGLRNI